MAAEFESRKKTDSRRTFLMPENEEAMYQRQSKKKLMSINLCRVDSGTCISLGEKFSPNLEPH
jgi:hypothetical protein